MPEKTVLSIGEVINLLRDDFPDVSVSKLRFLESQGLIDPKRSASGYRQFEEEDLSRLRFILQQQRDHFLPLKVIKSKLTVWERGEEHIDIGIRRSSTLEDPPEPIDRDDLLKRSNLEEGQLAELIEVGLIRPLPGTTLFPHEARIVAAEAARLMGYGLEPRHLRTVKLSVEREADLLNQLAAPLLKAGNADARAQAKHILEACSDAVLSMHKALLGAELRQQITP